MGMVQDEIGTLVVNAWVSAFRNGLTSMTSQDFQVTSKALQAEGMKSPDEQWTWWSQSFNVLPQSAMWVGAANTTWRTLGDTVLAALGVEDAAGQDSESTIRDIVGQSTSALVQQLTKKFGTEMTCQDPVPAGEPTGTPVVVSITSPGKFDGLELRLVFNTALFQQLGELSPSPSTADSSAPTSRTLPKSIADLHLNLHVTLGRTSLPLESILKLTVGSVIDLTRSVNDLVDVVVNGRTVASGQVVVCNGNYAVRIAASDQSERA